MLQLSDFVSLKKDPTLSLCDQTHYETAQDQGDVILQYFDQKQINLEYINFAASLSGLLQQIAGKNKAIATAGLILEKGAAIANVVVKAKESIATATANEAKVPFFTSIGAFTIPNPLKASSLATTLMRMM